MLSVQGKTYLGDRDVVDDHEERGKVRRVTVVGDEICNGQQTATEDGAGRQEAERDDGLFRHVQLRKGKCNQADETDDEHGENVVGLPAVGRFGGNVEGNEEEGKTGSEEKDPEDCYISAFLYLLKPLQPATS